MTRSHTRAPSYLIATAEFLRDGLDLPTDRIDAHASAVRGFARPDGAFAGRAGEGDLYYTDFAVRALHVLGRLEDETAIHADRFARAIEPRSIIDVVNRLSIAALTERLVMSDRDMLDVIEGHRIDDGGYGKRPDSTSGSTYHTFLAVACYDVLSTEVPKRRAVRRFLQSRYRSDGGFAETTRGRRGSTNPTAAAVATGAMLRLRSARVARGVVAFVVGMRDESGGWRATASSPCPDIMSTYTGLTTLVALEAYQAKVMEGARAFCESCEDDAGGFRAIPLDPTCDVEYTYYGLGINALIAGSETRVARG